MTAVIGPTFFTGLSDAGVERLLEPLPRRRFPAGAEILTEGERPAEMFVITAGVCAVFVKGADGNDTQIAQIGAGSTIGEMALFAGQAETVTVAPATMRTLTALEAVVVETPVYYAMASQYHQLLHNVGAILSARLTRSYQHAVQTTHGQVTVLLDNGAPAMASYALACSVAWHSRGSTLLLVVGHTGAADLEPLSGKVRGGRGAEVLLAPPTGQYAPEALAETVEELSHHHEHVLLLVQRDGDEATPPPAWPDARRLRVADTSCALVAGERPGHTLRAWSPPRLPWRPDRDGVVHVPALQAADERAIADGLLPSTTPAGRALGWLAMDLCGRKVGVALGAGAIRGYAHYGVLRVLERTGVQLDYIAGTSIGALIASMIALGLDAAAAQHEMETSTKAFKLTAPLHSLLSNGVISNNFRKTAGDRRIEDLELPLALVAADLTTGREVVFRHGLVRMATLASMAIPGIYPPIRMGDAVLVDGGIVNPVPISVTAGMGADVVIAVSLGRPAMEPMPDIVAVEGKGKLPTLVHTITRSIDVMQGRIGAAVTADATVLIEPDFSGVAGAGLSNFTEGRPYIVPGEAAAEAAMDAIRTALPWLKG